jgi:hypothetical protein
LEEMAKEGNSRNPADQNLPWKPNARQLTGVIKNCRAIDDLARILHEHRKALDHIHVSAAWVCVARIGSGRGAGDVMDAVEALQDRTWDVLDEMDDRGISNSMHSMAKLYQRKERVQFDQGLLEAMQLRAATMTTGFDPQQVGNVLWALATVKVRADRGLLEAMQRRATATAGEFKPQNVSNVLWALATMAERADRGLLEAMQRQATATAREFHPQGVANVLWALATMGEKADRGFMEAMQSQATATAEECIPQDVANVLWALATMGESADRLLLEAMQMRATATAGEFKPQNVANLLWGLATMGESADQGLLEAMQKRAAATADEFKPQEITNLLWALASIGVRADRGLLEAIQKQATAPAIDFTPRDVANLLWALATMGGGANRGLLDAIQARATATAGDFKPQDVANVLWSLATMGQSSDGRLVVLIDCLASRVLEFRDQLSSQDKSQLHLWLLSYDLDAVSGTSLSSGVARVKQEMGEECLQAFCRQTTQESEFQQGVAAAVRSALPEVEIEEEFRDARSGYSIDILVRRRSAAGSTKWAVEVDGPTHFLQDGLTPNGSTLLKRKQLGQLGYKVVPVPFWEWDVLRDKEAKQRYIGFKLKPGPETLPPQTMRSCWGRGKVWGAAEVVSVERVTPNVSVTPDTRDTFESPTASRHSRVSECLEVASVGSVAVGDSGVAARDPRLRGRLDPESRDFEPIEPRHTLESPAASSRVESPSPAVLNPEP